METTAQEKKEKRLFLYKVFLWIVIIGGFALTRFFRLTTVPGHLDIDEAGSAYDALCLARYGVDRYGNSWPLYMQNFGTGQSSLYVFLCALIFKLFGYSKFGLRLPVVLFSLLNLVFGVKLVDRSAVKPFFKEYAALLIVFCPVFVFQARFGLDCQLMLGMSTLLLWFWLEALERNSGWMYFACGVIGGLLLYSYILSYLVLPIFLLVLLIYTIFTKQFRFKMWVIMAIPLGILAAPLIMIQVINQFGLDEMHLGIFTLTKLFNGYRVSELKAPTPAAILETLKVIFVGDDYDFSSVPQFWNLYQVTIPLFSIGLIVIIRRLILNWKKEECKTRRNRDILILLWFVSMLIIGSTNETRIYRINAIYTVVVLIALAGFEWIYEWKAEREVWKIGVTAVLLVSYGLFSLYFVKYYFRAYAIEHPYPHYFDAQITDAVEYVCGHPELQTGVTFTPALGIYALPGSDLKPGEFDIAMDRSEQWRTIYFGSLQELSPEYNYIIPHGQYVSYCDELVANGFTRLSFSEADLFYME